METIKIYNENGFIVKDILLKEYCNKINDYVMNNEKNAFYETEENIKFGYKHENDINSPVFEILKKNKIIDNIITGILGDYDINVIRSYNKHKFISRDIEYHQEYYYNSLLPSSDNYKHYVQLFIALEDHNLENGCLKIIPKSHNMGLLPYDNIINSNLEHKMKVSYKSLNEAYKKNGIKNCILKAGEGVFFNHLIIHGSQNNNSPFNRKALVITFNKKG